LSQYKPTEADIFILDLFSNVIFMGTDEEGMATKAYRGEDGVYHIPGQLDVATQSILKSCMKASLPILEEAREAKLIFVLPLPRYAGGACCSDPEHIANFDEADYDSTLRDGARAAEKVIEMELKRMGREATIYDPLTPFETNVPLAEIRGSSGMCIWAASDPVHLSNSAYNDVLNGIMSVASDVINTTGGRQRLTSIIPTPTSSQVQRSLPEPAWIRGEDSNGGWQRGQYGSRRGRGGRGQRGGRGGRWRPY